MSDYTPSPRVRFMQRAGLGLIVLAGLLNFIDRTTLSIANPKIREEFGISVGQMGILLSAFTWSYGISQLPSGGLVDRFGPRRLLAAGLFLWSALQAVGGMVGSMTQLMAARIGLGAAEGPGLLSGAAVVSNWFRVKDRGVATGIFHTVTTLGPAIGGPLLTWLMLTWDWRVMFAVMGVLGMLVSILWYWIYRDPEDYGVSKEEIAQLRAGEPTRTRGVTFKQWRRLFRYRTTWGMIEGFAGVTYLNYLYFTWFPGYLEIEHHVSVLHAGLLSSVPQLGGFLGSLVCGWAVDKLVAKGKSPLASRKIPMVLGLIGMAAFTIPSALTSNTTLAVMGITLAVFCGNIASTGGWALLAVTVPQNYVASIGSIQNAGGYIGGALAPVVTGYLVQTTGSFVPALLVGAGCATMSAIFYGLVVKRPITGEELADGVPLAAAPAE